jgi:glycerol-3-phosphate dehydrogenase
VLELAAADPSLARPIVAGQPDLLAEARFAAAAEQASSVGDVLLRRTRLGLLAARECCCDGGEVARRVAATVGLALDWDAATVAASAVAFAEEARAEGIVVSA